MPSDLLAALMVDCDCGEQLLVGQAMGADANGDADTWRSTLVEVAERLDVPFVWSGDHARCPACGQAVSTAASTPQS